MDEAWLALSREAGLASEHLAIGATAIGRANYAQPAYYAQAFFALSTGFERGCKLALLVDHAIETGAFPSSDAVKKYGHALDILMDGADQIAERRGLIENDLRRPRGPIHEGIVDVLSEFATNITRYYNIDLVTERPGLSGQRDPVRRWFERVTRPVLAVHYGRRQRARREHNAMLVAVMSGDDVLVRHHGETGRPLGSAYEASLLSGEVEFAQPYVRMYVLQFARFLGNLLSHLAMAAHTSHRVAVPEFSEFFNVFKVTDQDFRRRRTWSIYPV